MVFFYNLHRYLQPETNNMIANIAFIEESFSKFNDLCFEGKLPPIPIKLTRARTFLGKVSYTGRRNLWGRKARNENYLLRISIAFDLAEEELEDVIIHEMIHYYIALNGLRDSSVHGNLFRQIMASINTQYGRHITVRHHAKEGQLKPKPETARINYICVSLFKDGNIGVTSCARTRILELFKKLPRYFHLQEMNWYVTSDPFFNRFPRSITPKIYKITKEELSEHLTGASPIRFKK